MSLQGALGVVHVPKTGGAALRVAFGGVAGCYVSPFYADASLIDGIDVDGLPGTTRRQFASADALRHICQESRLVIGHYSADILLESGCDQVATQLREPRARLLSLYRFWQSLPEDVIDGWGQWGDQALRASQLPLEEFLKAPGATPGTDNAIVRQLLGPRVRRRRSLGSRSSLTGIGRARYDALRDRLRIVEWSVDSQRFADRLSMAIGIDPVMVPRGNVTTVKGGEQEVDRTCQMLIERLTAGDRVFLDCLMTDGLIRKRTNKDLDDEFRAAAEGLEFKLVL